MRSDTILFLPPSLLQLLGRFQPSFLPTCQKRKAFLTKTKGATNGMCETSGNAKRFPTINIQWIWVLRFNDICVCVCFSYVCVCVNECQVKTRRANVLRKMSKQKLSLEIKWMPRESVVFALYGVVKCTLTLASLQINVLQHTSNEIPRKVEKIKRNLSGTHHTMCNHKKTMNHWWISGHV